MSFNRNTDIVYLAFANSDNRPLEELSKEAAFIHNQLQERSQRGVHFYPEYKPGITIEDVEQFFSVPQNRNRLVVFHFSGHAGMNQLSFQNGEVFSIGLAKKLGQCRRLKLVVLNGCSTIGWVKPLLEAKIPIVIATGAPVQDPMARRFSDSLYRNLCQGNLLEESFEMAITSLETFENRLEKLDIVRHRGLMLREQNADQPLWGIFSPFQDGPHFQYCLPGPEIVQVKSLNKRYLINRDEQDRKLKRLYHQKSGKVVSIVYGPSEELPHFYIDKVGFFANRLFPTNIPNEPQPKEPIHLNGFLESDLNYLIESVTHELTGHFGGNSLKECFERIYEQYKYQHVVFYTRFSIHRQNAAFFEKRKELFFKFWQYEVPKRIGNYQLVALMVLDYPTKKTSLLNFGSLFGENRIIRALEKAEQKDSAMPILPKLQRVEKFHFDVWVRNYFKNAERNIVNKFFYKEHFNQYPTISMEQFESLFDDCVNNLNAQ